MRLLWSVSLLALGLAALGSADKANAYNISSKGRVHERLTRLAEQCLASWGEGQPVRCDHQAIERARKSSDWKSDLAFATRWPDDPTRQISLLAGAKFVVNAGFRCQDYFKNPAKAASYSGLLCGSHYGPLQFFHSMRSSPSETPAQTREKMLDWVELAYGVATGRVGPDADYCSSIKRNTAFGAAMVPADFPYCEARPSLLRPGTMVPAWRVHTLFSLQCRNPLSSGTCTEIVGPEGARLARRNATGALLHLVQDSYSQSHTVRGTGDPNAKTFKPLIVCSQAATFAFYNQQIAAKANHGQADKYPRVEADSCAGVGTDDPVTASATLLWHIRANSSPDAVRRYVESRVLGAH